MVLPTKKDIENGIEKGCEYSGATTLACDVAIGSLYFPVAAGAFGLDVGKIVVKGGVKGIKDFFKHTPMKHG